MWMVLLFRKSCFRAHLEEKCVVGTRQLQRTLAASSSLEHLEKKIVYTHHDVRHGVRGKAAARPTCGAAAGKVQLNFKYPLSSIS